MLVCIAAQFLLLNASIMFSNSVLASGASTLAALGDFTYSLLPWITANLMDAAADNVNGCVPAWGAFHALLHDVIVFPSRLIPLHAS